jgi:hypothetical protein
MTRLRNVVAMALLNVTVPVAFGQSASAKIVAGSEHCREVHFPGGWLRTKGMKKAYMDHFLFGYPYEFRNAVVGPQEYLVAAVDHIGSHREYSPNKFSVNLRSGMVRSATQAELGIGRGGSAKPPSQRSI